MERVECEKKLMALAFRMSDIVKEYKKDMGAINVIIFNDGHISINNEYYGKDSDMPINVFGDYVNGTKVNYYRFDKLNDMTVMEAKK